MPAFIDLSGQQFGRWVVLGYAGRGTGKWRVRCECGTEALVLGSNLKRGATQSCGCLRRENVSAAMTKHGATRDHASTKTYSIWKAMKKRCSNPNSTDYPYYGGKGIKVCDRWRGSYSAFLEDMGECPSSDMTIDRIDASRDYEPENCRWATRRTQAENRAATKMIEFEGASMSLSRFAEILGKPSSTIWRNIILKGMTPEQVATKHGRM